MTDYPRPLTDGEIALLKSVFGNGLNYGDMRIDEGGFAATPTRSAIAMTHYETMRFPEPPADFSQGDVGKRAWLVHEAAHVWQWQQYGTDTNEKGSQLWMSRGGDYSSAYKFSLSDSFSKMNIEAQARAIEDRYRISQSEPPKDETDWRSDQPLPPLSAYDSLLQPFDAQNAKGPPPHRKRPNGWDRDGDGGGGLSEEELPGQSAEPAEDGLDVAIDEKQEQLRQRLQDIEAILSAIDEDALSTDKDVVDGFLDDLDAQLDCLDTLTGTDLLDRLRNLVDRLSEWRGYLQGQLELDANLEDDTPSSIYLDDPSNEDEDEIEEQEARTPDPYQEDEPEPEPEYARLDANPQAIGDERD